LFKKKFTYYQYLKKNEPKVVMTDTFMKLK